MNINHKSDMTKQEKARFRIAQKRKDPVYRERENALRRLCRIKDDEVRNKSHFEVDNINNFSSILSKTENNNPSTDNNIIVSTNNLNSINKRLKAKERMAAKRLDPEYALKERIRSREAKAKKRKDPAFLEFERAKNRQMMALKRKDPDYVSKERERARKVMAQKRKDESCARHERAVNRERLTIKLKDSDLE